MRKLTSVGVLGLAFLGACGGETPAGVTGLRLEVAPLKLAGIDIACYDIAVTTQTGTVWSQGAVGQGLSEGDTRTICSNQYGSGPGGDVTYIGPCDASADADVAPKVGVQNAVTIWVDGLYENEGTDAVPDYQPLTDGWADPCGDDGCTLQFDCVENQDTRVEFNFTILRDANQGFFDIIVNFEDVFCSAKVDCRYRNESESTSDDPVIRLVHDFVGVRQPTAVFAVACTGGAAAGADVDKTRLYMSNVRIDCAGSANDISVPVNVPGRVYAEDPAGLVTQAQVFMGEENLTSDGSDADKIFWSVAIAMTPTGGTDLAPVFEGTDCFLDAEVTAAEGDVDVALGRANVTYPFIAAHVALTGDNGALVCAQHPVNGGNGVSTEYTPLGDGLPASVTWEMTQQPAGGVAVQSYP